MHHTRLYDLAVPSAKPQLSRNSKTASGLAADVWNFVPNIIGIIQWLCSCPLLGAGKAEFSLGQVGLLKYLL